MGECDLPLALVELVLADGDLEVVPGESLATAVVIHHYKQFFIRKQRFIGVFQLLAIVHRESQIYSNGESD